MARRRSTPAPHLLDQAWVPVVEQLRAGPLAGLPVVTGGRSSGARGGQGLCRSCLDAVAIPSQLTALFTRAAIRSSSAAVNSMSAKDDGHMAPSSRFALSLNPSVAYRDLNLAAPWK